jgi:hypothetical protein
MAATKKIYLHLSFITWVRNANSALLFFSSALIWQNLKLLSNWLRLFKALQEAGGSPIKDSSFMLFSRSIRRLLQIFVFIDQSTEFSNAHPAAAITKKVTINTTCGLTL